MTDKELAETLKKCDSYIESDCYGCPVRANDDVHCDDIGAMGADAIERLLLENAELKGNLKMSEWISVDDRLPECLENVIVCRLGKGAKIVEQGMMDIGGWWKVYGTRTKSVTHWMPLPEPPEE